MARVTIEDCLENITNAFDIVTLASRRAKDLIDVSTHLIDCKDKKTVVALIEISSAHFGISSQNLFPYNSISTPFLYNSQIHSGRTEKLLY